MQVDLVVHELGDNEKLYQKPIGVSLLRYI
jgi:hypothetical protein